MKQVFLCAVIAAVMVFSGCKDEKITIISENDEDAAVIDDETSDLSNDPDSLKDDSVPDESNHDEIIIKDEENIPDEDETIDDFVESDDDLSDEVLAESDENFNDEDIEECIPQGGTVGVYPDAPECCEGLAKSVISHIKYENKRGYCDSLDGASVCINCGNSKCEEGENVCNCPTDCKEERNKMCDDGSVDMCDMMPPVDCEGSTILAVQNGCWHCVDPLTCKETDRDAHCDDGTIPTCKMPQPECSKSEILAYQNNCYYCVDPVTCK